jgi:hypothetical protein
MFRVPIALVFKLSCPAKSAGVSARQKRTRDGIRSYLMVILNNPVKTRWVGGGLGKVEGS